MNRNTYRLCVVMLIVAALISTIWYYQAFVKNNARSEEGVFVWEAAAEGYDL